MSENLVLEPKRRGRKPTSKDYFDDLEMRRLYQSYQTTHDENDIKQLTDGFIKIINGMINKQFYANSYVKKNRDDAIQLCLVEILKSLKHYNIEHKMFPYINRIAKNNLCLFTKRMKKYKNKEINFSNIIDEGDDGLESDLTNGIDTITLNNSNSFIDDTTSIESLKPLPKNKTIHCKSSLYIINKYINYLYDSIHYLVLHDSELCAIIYNMRYDSNADFEFEGVSGEEEYKNIVFKIDSALNDILVFLNKEYSDYIYVEPESYEGKLSNRAISYIKKFAKNRLKKNKDLKKYNVDELVKYLEYLVYCREVN